MEKKEEEFLEKLRDTFRIEAEEYLDSITSQLLELEKKSGSDAQISIMETMLRSVHSLKGASRAADFKEIEEASHAMESVLFRIRDGTAGISHALLDIIHHGVEQIRNLLFTSREARDVEDAEVPARSPKNTTVRVDTGKLASLMNRAEDMITVKLVAEQLMKEIQDLRRDVTQSRKDWAALCPHVMKLMEGNEKNKSTLRYNAQSLDISRFLETCFARMAHLENKVSSVASGFENYCHATAQRIDRLQQDMKPLLMQPLSLHVKGFPRMIRDLARAQGKSVDFKYKGENVEIDRRILEALKEPLLHIMRNCVDHGIEAPQVRQGKGKPGEGSILLSVAQKEGRLVEIAVTDDGEGIDPAELRKVSVNKGFLTESHVQALSDQEALELAFMSEVSTSHSLSTVSGRGLGLAIVKEKVENLGGLVTATTEKDRGTTFTITVPVTIAASRGVLIQAAGYLMAIPTARIERILRFARSGISTIENSEALIHEGQTFSLVSLAHVLGLQEKAGEDREILTAIILRAGEQAAAFLVDEVLGEQEMVQKSLDGYPGKVRNIAAVTLTWYGKVVPVLNVQDLLRSTMAVPASPRVPDCQPGECAKKSILVVEDSMTSRVLLKNILESAGYRVSTAVDGAEGLVKLKTGDFDLVVSDVTMPRMDGFELSSRIRSDRRLSGLPVILVTSLDSAEDKIKGIDAGANAFIVKSSFDQESLLDAIVKLL